MKKIVVMPGDGIGPEVTRAMQRVVEATGAPVEWHEALIGEAAFDRFGTLLPQSTLKAIEEHRIGIKGPTRTPQGKGHSSINVALRRKFDLFVGLRSVISILPRGPRMPSEHVDIALFRENTEGLYQCEERAVFDGDAARIVLEATFTAEAMTRLAERAFAFARTRKKRIVTLVTKSNIHKGWGRLYADAFAEVASRFADVATEHLLIDNCAQLLVTQPERFDVIVTENMFGDILADLCAGLIGGLGLAPGANIGDEHAVFEAVHGTADDIAGKGLANPAAMMLSGAMMLSYIGELAAATRISTAVGHVVRSGDHVTSDLRRYHPEGHALVGTDAFTDAVIAAL